MNTKKQNILVYAPGGVGIGHINRVCQLFSGIFSQSGKGDITILTDSTERDFIEGYGFEYEYFEYSLEDTLTHITFDEFDKYCSKKILEIYAKKNINHIFFDTFFPKTFLTNVYSHSSYLILRNTDISYLLGISEHFYRFRKIFIPHEIAEIGLGEQDILKKYENIEYIGNIVDPYYVEISTYIPINKQVLISPGYGGDTYETQKFISYCIKLSQKFYGYKIVVFCGSNKDIYEYFSENTQYDVYMFSHETYKEQFKNATIILARCGYNTINEIFYSQKKSLIFPAQRHHESQINRALYYTNKTANISLGSYYFKDDFKNIEELLSHETKKEHYFLGGREKFQKIFFDECYKKTLCVYKHIFIPQSEYFIYSELKELQKKYHVVIVCLAKEEFIGNTLPYYIIPNSKAILNPQYPFGIERSDHLKFLKVFTAILKRIGAESCYTEFLFDMLLLFPLASFSNVSFFSAARGNDIYSILPQSSLSQRRGVFSIVEKIFTRDNVMRGKLLQWGMHDSQIEICRSYLDIQSYTYIQKTFQKLDILIGGRFVEKKRITKVIELVSKIEKLGIVGKIGLIGNGIEKENIIKKIKECSLDFKVKHLGVVSHDVYKDTLQDYNCYISYSQSAKNGDDEGIPNILLENSLSGNLICTTITGGIAEIYNSHNAILLTGNINEDIEILQREYTYLNRSTYVRNAQTKVRKEYARDASLGILEKYL